MYNCFDFDTVVCLNKGIFPHLGEYVEVLQIEECPKFPSLVRKSVENDYFIQ